MTTRTPASVAPRFLASLLAVVCLALAAGAEIVVPDEAEGGGPAAAMALFRDAWLAADAEVLADLVSGDGAEMSVEGPEARVATVTPARARYLFLSLFRERRDHELGEAVVVSDDADDQVSAVMDWTFREGSRRRTVRLFLGWTRTEDGWRLAVFRRGR